MDSQDESSLVGASSSQLSAAEFAEIERQRVELRERRASAANRRAAREGGWILVTSFDSGDPAYWGTNRDGYGLTPYRGNACRYSTEAEALAHVPPPGFLKNRRFEAQAL